VVVVVLVELVELPEPLLFLQAMMMAVTDTAQAMNKRCFRFMMIDF
jgi:hypothetical protein